MIVGHAGLIPAGITKNATPLNVMYLGAMVRRLVIVCTISIGGCSDSSTDPAADAPGTDGSSACASNQPFVSETPVVLMHEGRPRPPSGFSADELTAYYSFGTTPFNPGTEIYIATRPDRQSGFSAGTALSAVNSATSEGGAVESSDGLELYLAREHMPGIQIDVFRATRASRADTFGAPEALNLDALQVEPSISPDGSELFFVYRSSYSASLSAIHRAVRSGSTFGSQEQVIATAGGQPVSSPTISGDGLTLYFARLAADGPQIWYLRRTAIGQRFTGTAEPLSASGVIELPVWESPDGCRLYVARTDGAAMLSR